MPIVFAENFKHDSPTSIVARYPGSSRGTPTGATPMIDTAWPLGYNSKLLLPIDTFNPAVNKRMELLINFAESTSGGGSIGISFLGIIYNIAAHPNRFEPANTAGTKALRKLHLIVDTVDGNPLLTVIMDGVVKCPPTVFSWVPSNHITVGSAWNNTLPPFIDSIVVAYDTPPNTRLDNPTWTDAPLTITESTNWDFQDVGLVEDMDKVNPDIVTPAVFTTERTPLEFTTPEAQYSAIYGAVQTDLDTVSINGSQVYVPPNAGKVLMPIVNTNAVSLQPAVPQDVVSLLNFDDEALGSTLLSDKAGNYWYGYGDHKIVPGGQFGSCIEFGPVPNVDYITMSDSSLIKTFNSWTVEFSVLIKSSQAGNYHVIFGWALPPTGAGFYIFVNAATLLLSTSTTMGTAVALANLARDTWVRVAVTYSHLTSKVSAYVNGVVASAANNLSVALLAGNNAYPAFLGNTNTSAPVTRGMLIDEFRVTRGVRYTANYTPSATPLTL